MLGRNNIILRYHYMVDIELGKCICEIFHITCACQACVSKLDKYWLPTIAPPYQPRYARNENCYYNKILEHYNDCTIMKLLENKATQVELDNIHSLILSGTSTNNV